MLQNTPTIPGGEHQMVVGVVSTMRLFAVVFHILETLAGQGQSFQWIHYIPVLKHGVLRRSNKFRFNISEPSGDKLGLEIIKANADQELQKKFGCEI